MSGTTSATIERSTVLLVVAVLGGATALFLFAYLQYVLAAVLLAYALAPAHRRLTPRIGARASSMALVVAALVTTVIPTVLLGALVLRQAYGLVRDITSRQLDLGWAEAFLARYLGVEVDLQTLYESVEITITPEMLLQSLSQSNGAIFGNVAAVLGGVSNAAIGFTIFLFVLYYLLKDGDRFVAWLRATAPLPASVQDRLYHELDRITWAVLVGNVLVAAVQAVLTGIGLTFSGFSNVIFWTFVTFTLSLLPLIGASIVWIPAAGFLLFVGRPVAAFTLFVYGALVVSLSDNYLRPLVVDRGAHLNPSVVVIGIFGGIAVFGFVGIFFGPIVLGGFKVALEVFVEEYYNGSTGEGLAR